MKGEFELIEQIKKYARVPQGCVGIGDDCAVIPQDSLYDTLISTDMLLEEIHFLRRVDAFYTGWKSVVSNVSDIAACGGSPGGIFLSLALPASLEDKWLQAFMKGFDSACAEYGFPLLGGDTCESEGKICVSVTVLGHCPKGKAIRRNGARPGDSVYVSGCLGDSAAGLKLLLQGSCPDYENPLVKAHLKPSARLREGISLLQCGFIHSMMDISDGIGSDLRHIMDESGCGVEIDTAKVPLSPGLKRYCNDCGLDPLDFAISGGEDYELLFTAPRESRIPVQCYEIGQITDSHRLVWKGSDKDYKGYNHFVR